MQATFYGAAREVTGSMHLIEEGGRIVALDCGMFQGRRKLTDEKNRNFSIDPARLDAIVVSHAHIDHTGRLPLLVKKGFRGPIYATPATRDLAAIMLADSAHIQEEDAKFLTRKHNHGHAPPVEPLYGARDVATTMAQVHGVPLKTPFSVTPGLQAEFFEAGHMLGSAEIRITSVSEPAKSVVFSGDLGRFGMPILRDPEALPECDTLICESTYGGRTTPSNVDLKEQLGAIIRETFGKGGKVIIPAFSVGRTQTIVYFIHQLSQEGKLSNVPVFIDSPLAVDATEVFKLHPECYDADAIAFNRETGDLLGACECTYIRNVEGSKALDRRDAPCVIISASGMCENGRILHHLKNTVTGPQNTIMIVGFQAAQTLGRRIEERQPKVQIFGDDYSLRARVEVLHGFSAHADRDELRRLIKPLAPRCRQAFLVHGEPDQMDAMASWMREDGFAKVSAPEPGTTVNM